MAFISWWMTACETSQRTGAAHYRSASCGIWDGIRPIAKSPCSMGLSMVLPVRIELTTSPLPRGCSMPRPISSIFAVLCNRLKIP